MKKEIVKYNSKDMSVKLFGVIIVSLIAFLSGCKQSADKGIVDNEVKNESLQADIEDFDVFYTKFINDSAFQMSRINFPLEGEIVDSDTELSPIGKDDWDLLLYPVYEVDTTEYTVEIDENPTEVLHRIYIENSGVDIIMKYTLSDNKWYLIYYKSHFL